MFTKRKIILIISIVVVMLIWLMPGIFNYLEYQKTVKAIGGMPWQDGGIITMVREPCVLDTPQNAPTTCAVSCPLVTSIYGSACTGYIELDTQSQFGTMFIAVPLGFLYKGGGTHPSPGMQYIAGGASNAMPWVIGIPGASASRIQKMVDIFKYIIVGFKK